ncbi:uncharacterized protein [Apostichopus japonicus]|uniref:uncharacterized protein n=1 Tax=Stichopus japonicus TaxID=307972 RepID=UPI003AB71B1C
MDGPLRDNKALARKYRGVPKRYEDTKPVQTQAFTHSSILEIGQNIHVKWENKTDEERSIAIEAAEEAVWKQATHVKEIALEKCRKLAEEELDKRMKEKDLECEKALKEQTIKIETDMKQIALQQVRQERERAQGVLEQTKAELIEEKNSEREEAVAVARKEEIQKALEETERVAGLTSAKSAETAKEAEADKATALKELTAELDRVKVDAILNTQMEERRAAAVELGKIQQNHKQEIAKLKEEIKAGEARHQDALDEIEREKQEKEGWIEKYNKLKTSYQLFINETVGFKKGQAEFLL